MFFGCKWAKIKGLNTGKLTDSLNINFWLQIMIKPLNLHSLWKSNRTPLTHRTDHVWEVIKEAKQRCLGERIPFPKLFNGVKKPYILSPSTQMYLDKRNVNRPHIEHLCLNNIWTQLVATFHIEMASTSTLCLILHPGDLVLGLLPCFLQQLPQEALANGVWTTPCRYHLQVMREKKTSKKTTQKT